MSMCIDLLFKCFQILRIEHVDISNCRTQCYLDLLFPPAKRPLATQGIPGGRVVVGDTCIPEHCDASLTRSISNYRHPKLSIP